MGQLVKLIEIRRSGGLLLIARKGTLPAAMLRAGDIQRRDHALRTLAQDRPATIQLRAQWQNVFPARPPESLAADELARLLLRELAAGTIEAVLLRAPRLPLTPADVAQITTGAINVGNAQRRLLVARKGALPPEVLLFANNPGAIEVLGRLRDGDETARQIDLQGGRLNPNGKSLLQGAGLRRHLAQQIAGGALDAAVVTQPAAAGAIAARPDAQTPVGRMSSLEKIGAALGRSMPYAIETGGNAIRLAVEDFLRPESIAVMIAIAAGVALANTNPLTGAAVDTTLVLLAWVNGGLKAVNGITDFAMATLDAQDASTEQEIEAAAKAYGKALGAMGPDLLNAIVGRFVPKKGGAGGRNKAVPVSQAAPGKPPAKKPVKPAQEPKKAEPKPQRAKARIPSGETRNISADEANHFHKLKGNRPPYAPGKPVKEIVTDSDEVFVRVHGGSNQAGSWVMRPEEIRGLSPQQIKDKFALPELPTHVSDVSVPAGTKIRVGEAGALPPWGGGGGTQVEVMERTSVFSNQRPLQ